MDQDVLLTQYFENIRFFRKSWIARRLKRTVFQIRERIVHDEWRQVRHRERPVGFVNVHFRQIEKFEKQFPEIARTIGFDLKADGIATTGTAQFLFDGAEKIFGFFLLDVEIAVPGDAKGVNAVENQSRK